MKQTKKRFRSLLAATMALALLLGVVPVYADSVSPPSLTLNEECLVTVPEGQQVILEFTPTQTGIYQLVSLNGNDPQAWLYTSDNMDEALYYSDDTNTTWQFCLVYCLNAGTRYSYVIDHREDETPFSVKLTKLENPTAMEFPQASNKKITLPLGGYGYELDVRFSPENITIPAEWTLSDPSLANISGNNLYVQKTGTADLTAALPTGLSDTVEVTVTAPTAIAMEQQDLTLPAGAWYLAYTITPTTTGQYCIEWNSGCPNTKKTLALGTVESDSMRCLIQNTEIDQADMTLEYGLQAGVTYYVTLLLNEMQTAPLSTDKEMTLDFVKMVPATALSFAEGQTLTVTEGTVESFYLNLEWAPDYAIEEFVEWSSDNEGVATCSYGEVFVHGLGTATITAQSIESSLSATFTITVVEPKALSLSTPTEVKKPEFCPFEKVTFTPQESGMYFLQANTAECSLDVFDEQQGWVASGSEWIQMDLQAAQTYTIHVFFSEEADSDATLTMLPMVEATGVDIISENESWDWQITDICWLDYGMVPQNSKYEEAVWTSSDETVVSIIDGEAVAHKPGTVTLTVTTENGLSDTIDVVVHDVPDWVGEKTENLYFNPKTKDYVVRFTVEEDGTYAFYSTGNNDTRLTVFEENEGRVEQIANSDDGRDLNFYLVQDISADKTYYLHINTFDVFAAFPVTVEKVQNAQSPELPEEGINVLADTYSVTVGSTFLPEYVIAEGDALNSVTSSDDTVAAFAGEWAFFAKAPGTITLTYETVEGFSDTVEVQITETPALTLNQPVATGCDASLYEKAFTFTPTENGTYIFSSIGGRYPFLWWCDQDWNVLDNSVGNIDRFAYDVDLQAGETYYIRVHDNSTESDMQVVVKQAQKATGVTIKPENSVFEENGTYYVQLNEHLWFDVVFQQPDVALWEDYDITWDSDVLKQTSSGVKAIKAGTTKVKVTTSNGLTDEITICVFDWLAGDLNLDGVLDVEDARLLGRALNDADKGGIWLSIADMNGDAKVDLADYWMMPGVQWGDVDYNNKVDSTDARLVLQYAVKKIPVTSLETLVADVSGDGKVDSTDARLILQYAVKKIAKFPVNAAE